MGEREVRERTRSRSFKIGTAVLLAAVLAAVVVPSLVGGGRDSYDVGVVGAVPESARDAVVAAGEALDAEVSVAPFPDEAAAAAALRDDRADLVLVGDREVLVGEPPDADSGLAVIAGAAARAASLAATLDDAGVPAAAAADALAAPPLPVRALEPGDDERGAERGVAFGGLLVLYLALLITGLTIATGVVQEKSTRVVELLAAVVPARRLLAGKLLGIGLVELARLALVAVPAAIAVLTVGGSTFPEASALTIVWVVVWFTLGFALYGLLYAAVGALAGRQEDIQNVTGPLTLAIVGGYFVGLAALDDPDSTLALVASFVPFAAPMAMVPRLALGSPPAWETALSIALMLLAIAGALWTGARIYEGALLRTGRRIRILEAWRSPS